MNGAAYVLQHFGSIRWKKLGESSASTVELSTLGSAMLAAMEQQAVQLWPDETL